MQISLYISKDCFTNTITDSHQKFLALMIPEAWKYTVLVETHDKLGHQGLMQPYYLIK